MLFHRSHSGKRGFPLLTFSVAFVISIGTTAFTGWQLWQAGTRFEGASRKHIALTEGVNRIMLLDEVLTMSARLCAATGDFSYEKRYDRFEPQLTTAIDDLRELLPELKMEEFVRRTDEANLALVKMERQAFAWTHQGRGKEAMILLTSDEYAGYKKIYAGGMQETVRAKDSFLKRDIQRLHSVFQVSAALNATAVLVLLATWFIAARFARGWAVERMESENGLREARDVLEVRIKQRTADLLNANEELRHEASERKRVGDELNRSHEAIRQSEESKRLLLHAIGEGIFGVDTAGQLTFVNPAALRMLGLSAEEVLGQRVHGLIHHSHKDGSKYPVEDCPMHASLTKAVDSHVMDEVLWRKDGSNFPVEYSSTPIRGDGRVMGAVVIFMDITERKRVEEALLESEDRYRNLFVESRDAVMTLEPPSWAFTSGNPATLKMFGAKNEAEFLACAPWELSPELQPDGRASDEKAKEMINKAMRERSCFFEWVHKRIGGEEFIADVLLSRVKQGEKVFLHALVRDITKRKHLEDKIQQMADHDSLTGLPNRRLFSDRLGITLARAQRNQKKVGIAMLDLDGFKGVNDNLGHDAGDLLLKETAERLSAMVRKGDTVARFGGDEFLLILPDLEAMENASQVAQRIVDGLQKPFLIDTHRLVVTASIGIAFYPNDGMNEDILLKNADLAMYQAKQAGGGRYQLLQRNLKMRYEWRDDDAKAKTIRHTEEA